MYDPWTIIGWLVVVALAATIVATPFAVGAVLAQRRRFFDDFEEVRGDVRRGLRHPTRRAGAVPPPLPPR